jgi:sortase A
MGVPIDKKRTRGLESVFLATGALLLGGFVAITAWNHFQSQSAISAFEEARAASVDYSAPLTPDTGPQAASFVQVAGEPDYTMWSEKRIAEYRESLLNADDDPHALLTIDRLNIRVPVYNGADDLNLNRGVARITGTGRFSLDGNLGIAGHRDGFFRPLKDIQVGDSMTVETLHGVTEFVVASINIVDPTEVSVLAPTDTPSVTLVTCYPFYFVGHAPQRFIVRGEIKSHTVTS